MIVIAVPMASGADPACLGSLWGVARYATELPVVLAFSQGIYTPKAREELVADQILPGVQGLEAVVWVDADMGFTPDDFRLLVEDGRKNRGAVVGGFYPSRVFENQIVGKPLSGNLDECWSPQVHPADHLGCGFLWTPAEVYAKVPRPWFDSGWKGTEFLTEDVYFSRKVREAGIPVLGCHYRSLGHAYHTRRSMRLLLEGGR